MPMRRGTAFALIAIAASLGTAARVGDAAEVVPLGPELAAGRLAVTANGQTVVCVDEGRRAIVAFDPLRPEKGRDLVAPANPALPEPVAVGCLPGDVVAVVCRAGGEWSLRTYRTEPGKAADPAEPIQLIRIGTASGSTAEVSIAVSHARGWLAVAGLPPPLVPVLRAAVAGVRLGPLTDRSCPRLPDGLRPIAAAVSPSDEIVLALRGSADDEQIAFYDAAGHELLRLAACVKGIGGIAFGRGDGLLWAAATGGADGRAGLWRLDAVVREGKQEIRPTLVAAVAAARDVAAASERTLVVASGNTPRRLIRIDPTITATPNQATGKGTAP